MPLTDVLTALSVRLTDQILLGADGLPKRLAAAPALGPRLVENLDEETARRAEVSRPGSVEFMGWFHVEAIGLQPLVDCVHLLPAVLPEADVKSPWIDDLSRLVEVVQGQNEPRLIDQHDEGIALGLRNAPEAKVLFEECPCLGHIRDSEIEMVECHVMCLHVGETPEAHFSPVARH